MLRVRICYVFFCHGLSVELTPIVQLTPKVYSHFLFKLSALPCPFFRSILWIGFPPVSCPVACERDWELQRQQHGKWNERRHRRYRRRARRSPLASGHGRRLQRRPSASVTCNGWRLRKGSQTHPRGSRLKDTSWFIMKSDSSTDCTLSMYLCVLSIGNDD